MVLLQQDAVLPLIIMIANENGLTTAGDENIVLIVHCATVFGEYGDCAIISSFAITHEGCGEVINRASICCA